MKKVLTPEQASVYDANREQMKARRASIGAPSQKRQAKAERFEGRRVERQKMDASKTSPRKIEVKQESK